MPRPPGVALAEAFALFARPLTRMVGVAVRGSVGDASRICGGFLRVHGASIPPPPSAGLCHARPSGVRAGERYGTSVRRCAGRLGQVAPVPCATHGFAPTAGSWAGPGPGQYNWAGTLRPRNVVRS